MADFEKVQYVRQCCFSILPQLYCDRFSITEQIGKIVTALNKLIENNNKLEDYVNEIIRDVIESGEIEEIINDMLATYILNVKFPPNGLTPAVGDGTADDTIAIQGCIDYANTHGGMCVFFPSGKYLSQSLTLKDNVSLFGFDNNSVRIVHKGGATSPLLLGICHNNAISGITLDGNGENQVNNNNVLHLTGGNYNLYNLNITDGYDNAYLLLDSDCFINMCKSDRAGANAWSVNGNGNLLIDNLIVNNLSSLSGQYALYLNVDNAIVTNLYSNALTNCALYVGSNNCFISAKITNTTIDYIDVGVNNSIDIHGNSSKEVYSYTKTIKARQIILDSDLGIEYKQPIDYNEYFRTIPFSHDSVQYDVLVKGDKNLQTDINNLNTAIETERTERITALQTETNARIAGDNTLNTAITNEVLAREVLEHKVNVLERRSIIFVGDSYSTGFNVGHPDTSNWMDNAISYINKDNITFYTCKKGGTSFGNTILEYNFLQQLKDWESVVSDKTSITDIIVCGGRNDFAYSLGEILTGISAFISYCKTAYPKATVSIGMIGGYIESNYVNPHRRTVEAYSYASQYGGAFINNLEWSLLDSIYMAPDTIHPSEFGQQMLGKNVANYVLNKNVCTSLYLANSTSYFSTGLIPVSDLLSVEQYRINGEANIRNYNNVAYNTVSPFDITCNGGELTLGQFNRLLIIGDSTEQNGNYYPIIILDGDGIYHNTQGKIYLKGTSLCMAPLSVKADGFEVFTGVQRIYIPPFNITNKF